MRQKPTGGRRTDSGKPARKTGGGGRPSGDRKPFRGEDRDNERPARGKKFEGGDRPKRSFDKPERSGRSFDDDSKGSFRDPNRGAAGGRKAPYSGRDTGAGEGGGYKKRPYSGRDTGGASSGGERKRPYSGREGVKGNFDEPKRGGFDKAGRGGKSFGNSERPKRSFDGEDRPKRSYDKPQGERKSYGDSDRPKRSFDNNEDRPKRNAYGKPMSDSKHSFDKGDNRKGFDGDEKPKKKFDKQGNEIHPFDSHLNRAFNDQGNKKDKPERQQFEDQTFEIKGTDKLGEDTFDKPFPLGARKVSGPFRKQYEEERKGGRKLTYDKKGRGSRDQEEEKQMTLNKYIAHSGKCSRRDAAEMVKQGKVKVNGELALDPGYRVQSFDVVTIAGKKLTPQRDRVYVLLNKPKDYITTNDDPEGRKTVMDLVSDSELGRLFPVGRLDRNTTGLLLMTNDGELAQKLSHPSYDIKKVYQATLNKPLIKADFEKIANGLMLDDGEVKVDAIAYLDEKNEIGLEIHSGRNRIVRRIFESLGYEVEKLDRVMYAGLTKKNLPRGKWRLLTEKEIILLKHFKG